MATKDLGGKSETSTRRAENGGAPVIVDGAPTDCPTSSAIDVDAIRERCEAATPGPWFAKGEHIWSCANGPVVSAWWDQSGERGGLAADEVDAAFIAHARTDLPAALDEIDRLRDERDRLQELVDEGRAAYDELVAENGRLLACAERGLYNPDAGRRGD